MAIHTLTEEIWRKPRVLAATGMGNTWLYNEIAEGRFPAPVKLGARAVGWRRSDVLSWIESRQPEKTAQPRATSSAA